MKRKASDSPTMQLARWFREQIQGQPWSFNHPTCRMLMGQAAMFVNPKRDDGHPLDPEDVKRAVIAVTEHMRKSKPNWIPNNLMVITWNAKEGKTFFDVANEVPPMPPLYETISVRAWLDKYGDRALGEDKAAALREQLGV